MTRIIGLIFGVAAPRFTIFILSLFTDWFDSIGSFFVLFLGFLLVPYTLLWYSVVLNWYGGVWGPFQTGVLIVAIIFDVTPAKRLLGR